MLFKCSFKCGSHYVKQGEGSNLKICSEHLLPNWDSSPRNKKCPRLHLDGVPNLHDLFIFNQRQK